MEYAVEVLSDDADNGTMVDSLEDLRKAVIGQRIVSVGNDTTRRGSLHGYGDDCSATILTLDNGRRVRMVGEGECCAYTEVNAFLLHPEMVDHMIMGVGTTDGYTTWHIYADLGDILELTVGWSCGNPFYYGYGFKITVEDIEEGVGDTEA